MKYFVVSLPRTGTKTICKMAEIAGLRYKHVPSIKLYEIYDDFDLFADTPCYSYDTILKLVKNECNKLIYIDRDINEWWHSFQTSGMVNNYKNLLSRTNLHPINQMDKDSLNSVFNGCVDENNLKKYFKLHREFCLDFSPDRLLKMNLKSLDWSSFCNFTKTTVDFSIKIPHINAGTLYEKI